MGADAAQLVTEPWPPRTEAPGDVAKRVIVHADEAVAQTLSAYPAEQLVVGGSADALWPPNGPQPSGEVMYVDGADHGMHRGGVRESNDVHMDVVDRVRTFAKSVAEQV